MRAKAFVAFALLSAIALAVGATTVEKFISECYNLNVKESGNFEFSLEAF